MMEGSEKSGLVSIKKKNGDMDMEMSDRAR